MKLLIAEDNTNLLKSLKHILESNNYSVDAVSNGIDALNYACSNEYDGIVLDIMMPELDGLQVLSSIRQKEIYTPVLFLTAKTEINDRIQGLDMGADDYVLKPFCVQELLARIKAMLRRKEHYTPDIIKYFGLELNKSTYEIKYLSKQVLLSAKEFQLLEMLMQKPNCIITTTDFLTHIWGWDSVVDVSVIWVHISNIRKKLNTINAPIEIYFIRGAGYKLRELND